MLTGTQKSCFGKEGRREGRNEGRKGGREGGKGRRRGGIPPTVKTLMVSVVT